MSFINNDLKTPSNIPVEKAILSCIMLDPNLLYNCDIDVEHFYKPEHKHLFRAILLLLSESASIDLITIREKLRTIGKFNEVGGDGFLATFPDKEFVIAHWDNYLKILKDSKTLRDIIHLGTTCITTGYNASIEADNAMVKVHSTYDKLFSADRSDKTYTLADLVSAEFDALNERITSPDKIGIPTGFKKYDMLSGGLHPTDLIVLAARPSMGKTALLLKMLLNLAESGVGSYLWEFEMGKAQLIQRLTSIKSGVDLIKIMHGKLSEEEYNKVTDALTALSGLPIFIETNMSASIYDVMLQTRRKVNSEEIKVVAIDHVQLMLSDGINETQELGNISRQMKKMAMDLDITSILISQLNRNIEKRVGKARKPALSDLRQSGRLEEDADQVLFLYRDNIQEETKAGDYYNADVMVDLILAKHRNGPQGTLPLIFRGRNTNFLDFDGD